MLCQPDKMPKHLSTHGITLGHFFGRELVPYTPGLPAPAECGDWIPEYSPQEEDDLADNQDSTEYPEHPADEQRD